MKKKIEVIKTKEVDIASDKNKVLLTPENKILIKDGVHEIVYAQKVLHHVNVETNLITLTEDKLLEIVERYFKKYENFIGSLSYFGIALTVFVSLCTADFEKSFLGITGDIIKYIFISIFAIFIYLFISTVIKMKYIFQKKPPFIKEFSKTKIKEGFINDLKKLSNDLVNSKDKQKKSNQSTSH